MLVSILTPEQIRPFFQSDYYHRGMNYYQEDRVHDLDIEIEKNSEIITACVEGSGQNHYQVSIELSGRPNQLYLRGTCTCPIAVNCKHVIAAVLAAIEDHEFLLDEMDLDEMDLNERDENISSSPKRDPQVDAWLGKLKSIIKEEKKPRKVIRDETYSLRYIFYSPSYNYSKNDLHIKLELVRHLKQNARAIPLF